MTGRVRLILLILGLAGVLLACGQEGDDGEVDRAPDPAPSPAAVEPVRVARTGGMGAAFDDTGRAFSLIARNINHIEIQAFADGRDVFEAVWDAEVSAEFAGLGPNFDASACSTCHTDDGRSAGPGGNGVLPLGMTVGLGSDDPATIDHFGAVLSSQTFGPAAEAATSVAYVEVGGEFDDGTPFSLRAPTYTVEIGDGSVLPDDSVLRVRVAPQLPGMGLLELIRDADLLAIADPDDVDGDGISGRVSTATDLLSDTTVVGRFGWNASQPTVEQQTATALFNDMGLTSRYFPSPACDRWAPCVRAGVPLSTEYNVAEYGDPNFGVQEPAGGEVSDLQLLNLTIYTQALAVPAARDLGDPIVERGSALFDDAGCASCHTGGYVTRDGPIQGLSAQLIQPYTDLLVHDMGPDLADRTVAGDPVLTEWRTPPLWGIGLIDEVSRHTTFLHDGRARSLSEAILWHGGEGEASAAAYRAMSLADREALLAFLESL
ncbi:MAG: di-heme oxidoredictase family protein [Actinomycetota bacterium]